MIEKDGNAGNVNIKEEQAEPTLDQLAEQYVADPESLSLEECRRVYQHFLEQVEAASEEADTLRGAIGEIDRDLEGAQRGDPGYMITARGTCRKRDAEMKMAPVDQLIPDMDNGDLFREMEGEDFEQLKGSLREIGIIEPIVVDSRMRVICGHQRLRAAKAIGLQSVPVIIRSVDKEETRAIMAIEENIRRRQLQPSEMARAIKKLVELKGRRNKAAEVAKEIGLSKSQVYLYRDLSHLIPEISTLLDRGNLTQQTAIQIAKLDEDVQRVLYQALGERINEQKVIEFKRDNADLIKQVEKLSAEAKRREQLECELKAENNKLKDYLDRAEFKAGDLLKERRQMEEELQKTRAESYQKVQEKQALIDKLAKNIEPKVVPPPDYQAVKAENAKLKTTLKELGALKGLPARPPEMIMTEVCELIAIRLLPIDLKVLKGKLSPHVKEQLKPLVPKLEVWVGCLKELISEPTQGKKR